MASKKRPKVRKQTLGPASEAQRMVADAQSSLPLGGIKSQHQLDEIKRLEQMARQKLNSYSKYVLVDLLISNARLEANMVSSLDETNKRYSLTLSEVAFLKNRSWWQRLLDLQMPVE